MLRLASRYQNLFHHEMEKKEMVESPEFREPAFIRRTIQKVLAVSFIWFGRFRMQLDFFQGVEWLTAEETELMIVE